MRTYAQKQNRLQPKRWLGAARPQRARLDEADERLDQQAAARSLRDFSRAPVNPHPQARLQTKLAVSAPGDLQEQEADHIAERVMRLSEPGVQRDCDGGACPACQTSPDEG